MPEAFKNAGLFVGLIGTFILGFICTHCMHMLVNCSHELCRRLQVPSLSFSEVVYNAFDTGPIGLRKYAHSARYAHCTMHIYPLRRVSVFFVAIKLKCFFFISRKTINIFLCITQLGFCCVYFVFVAVNLQEVVEHYFVRIDIRIYLLIILIPMIMLNFLKNLKYLAPVSLFASFLTVVGEFYSAGRAHCLPPLHII